VGVVRRGAAIFCSCARPHSGAAAAAATPQRHKHHLALSLLRCVDLLPATPPSTLIIRHTAHYRYSLGSRSRIYACESSFVVFTLQLRCVTTKEKEKEINYNDITIHATEGRRQSRQSIYTHWALGVYYYTTTYTYRPTATAHRLLYA